MRLKCAGAALAAAATIASCAPSPAPPAPVPASRPAPPPPQQPPPPPADWRDGPLSPGDWRYDQESAIFSATFASLGGPLFALRCEPGRRITFFRPGSPGGQITIVTSYGERTLPGSGNEDQVIATLAAADPLLDQMVFSRGRFLVRVSGAADLVLPSWPEPARVIEECRR